jgi:hypothetical protein
VSLRENAPLFLSYLYVCPESVLANDLVLVVL